MRKLALLLIFLLGTFGASSQNYAVPGNIAYIGSDNNIYTYELATGEHHALTDDARLYQYPVWSTDGRLAYFCCDTPQLDTQVYISEDGISPGNLVYQTQPSIFTYAYWSPRNCDIDDTCRDLSILISEPDGFSVVLVRDLEDDTTTQVIGRGSPFYYSWSPDGSQIVTQRNQRQLDIYHVKDESFQSLALRPGIFPAPAWSPVDDRVLFGVFNPETRLTDLMIYAGDTANVLVEGLSGEVAFNWSPDGNMIAYRSINQNGVGELIIIDAITGEVITRTQGFQVLSFFWSPDSEKIAIVTIAQPRGTLNISYNQQETPLSLVGWSLLEINSGAIRDYGNFTPTDEMIYMLSYFNQFAQSHRVWSPDSTHIIFSEVLPNNQGEGISILDMTRPDTVPFFIVEGVIGIWSYH